MSDRRWNLLLLTTLLVGTYYYWISQAAGNRFPEVRDVNAFYDMLGRALLKGQTYLELQPRAELLALPNPWDPQQNVHYRLHDAVLFNGKFYIYHGVVPAVLFFMPWRFITGYDLSQQFAVFAMVLLGTFFWVAAVPRLAGVAKWGAITVIGIGLSSGIPSLLNRADFYEVAISGGYLCVGAGVFFLARRQYAMAGLCFGLAVGCRPHLGLVGAFGFVWLLMNRRSHSEMARYVAPFAFVLALLAWYNYQRFGNPFEFGVRYLLATAISHQHIRLSLDNFVPGAYFFLWSPPDIGPVFPWIRAVPRHPEWIQLPAGYFLEGTIGLTFFAPASFLAYRARGLAGMLALSGTGIFIFDVATGFTTQRYFIDFVPLLIFAAAVASSGRVFTGLAVFGAVVNMLLALSGTTHEYLKKRPESYLRLASAFSPIDKYRPIANPPLDISFVAKAEPMPTGTLQPLLSVGQDVHRYLLYTEHARGTIRVISGADESGGPVAQDLPETAPLKVHVRHEPEQQLMWISINDGAPVPHKVGLLVSAPSQVRVGENDPFYYPCPPKFTGTITRLP